MSSYEAQATATLQAATEDAYRSTYLAGSHFARARSDAAKASDLVVKLGATIDLLVAAEALHDASETAVKSLRAVLAATMSETGATSIQATHHTAHLAKRPDFLNIADETKIPPEYWVQPPKAIDKRLLKSALKDGTLIEGVNLMTPNEMSLVIRARETKP